MNKIDIPRLSITTHEKLIWSVPAPKEGDWLRALSDEALMKEMDIRKHPLLQASHDLVDAVERYMRQECLRSELYQKKETLKRLLNGND